MSTECQEDTSGKNDSSESQPVFLAKGHQVQHPSVLSLTPSRQLGYSWVISCCQGSEFAQHRSVLLICYHFVPGNTLSSRAYSYGPNAAQLLLWSFPTPALMLVPEIMYSQVSAFGLKFLANLENFQNLPNLVQEP